MEREIKLTKEKITAEMVEQIVRLYYDCYSTGRVAERMGLSRLQIMQFYDDCFDEDIHMAKISVDEAIGRVKAKLYQLALDI